MNPGASEEAAKAAGTFMEALKAQPLSLALVVMNVALLLLFWIIAEKTAETRHFEMGKMFEHQQLLLDRCGRT